MPARKAAFLCVYVCVYLTGPYLVICDSSNRNKKVASGQKRKTVFFVMHWVKHNWCILKKLTCNLKGTVFCGARFHQQIMFMSINPSLLWIPSALGILA